jgi:hypothetical protein
MTQIVDKFYKVTMLCGFSYSSALMDVDFENSGHVLASFNFTMSLEHGLFLVVTDCSCLPLDSTLFEMAPDLPTNHSCWGWF